MLSLNLSCIRNGSLRLRQSTVVVSTHVNWLVCMSRLFCDKRMSEECRTVAGSPAVWYSEHVNWGLCDLPGESEPQQWVQETFDSIGDTTQAVFFLLAIGRKEKGFAGLSSVVIESIAMTLYASMQLLPAAVIRLRTQRLLDQKDCTQAQKKKGPIKRKAEEAYWGKRLGWWGVPNGSEIIRRWVNPKAQERIPFHQWGH